MDMAKFCVNCGTQMEDDAVFCSSCGKSTAENEVAAASSQSTVAPKYNSQTPAYAVIPVDNSPLSVSEYVLTLFIFTIPLVNIIMALIWAFGGNVNMNRQKLCRAWLILILIFIALSILSSIIFGASVIALINSLAPYQ
jgi:uncharacterized membrane protein YvbJ